MAGTQVPRDPNMSAEVRRFLDDLSRRQETANIFYNLTATQATALLDVFTSALKGLVPASGGGTANFLRADGSFAVPPGTGLAGMVLQVLQDTYATNTLLGVATGSTAAGFDDTVPLVSEGDEVLSQAITLANSANKVLAEVFLVGGASVASGNIIAALFRGSTCINSRVQHCPNANNVMTIGFDVLDTPGSVGPHTYTVRVSPGGGASNIALNGNTGGRHLGGSQACTLTVSEIKG